MRRHSQLSPTSEFVSRTLNHLHLQVGSLSPFELSIVNRRPRQKTSSRPAGTQVDPWHGENPDPSFSQRSRPGGYRRSALHAGIWLPVQREAGGLGSLLPGWRGFGVMLERLSSQGSY